MLWNRGKSLMRKFDEAFKILEALKTRSLRILDVLSTERKLTGDEIDEVRSIFDERKSLLERIGVFYESEEFKSSSNEEIGSWEKAVDEVLKVDKNNLNYLQKRSKELNLAVRDKQKRKSLLIYNKGK